MTSPLPITTLLLDIGGVLLTDGWGHEARAAAAATFHLEREDLESRHHRAFDTYEVGKLSLDEYLDLVVFHVPRSFTRAEFTRFMFAQSQALPGMIRLIRDLKAKHALKVLVLSNEGRELNAHRIRTFQLEKFVDAFISSSFVHLRKPDPDIYHLALNLAQVSGDRLLYLENTPMFVRAAEALGIRSLLHTDVEATTRALAELGLRLN